MDFQSLKTDWEVGKVSATIYYQEETVRKYDSLIPVLKRNYQYNSPSVTNWVNTAGGTGGSYVTTSCLDLVVTDFVGWLRVDEYKTYAYHGKESFIYLYSPIHDLSFTFPVESMLSKILNPKMQIKTLDGQKAFFGHWEPTSLGIKLIGYAEKF